MSKIIKVEVLVDYDNDVLENFTANQITQHLNLLNDIRINSKIDENERITKESIHEKEITHLKEEIIRIRNNTVHDNEIKELKEEISKKNKENLEINVKYHEMNYMFHDKLKECEDRIRCDHKEQMKEMINDKKELQDKYEKLFYTTSVSSKKGSYGEKIIEQILTELLPENEITDTTKKGNIGDFIIEEGNNNILYEHKHMKINVPKKDILKFVKNVEENKYIGGILGSHSTGVCTKKHLYPEFTESGKIIVYLHNVFTDRSSIRTAINLITFIHNNGVTRDNTSDEFKKLAQLINTINDLLHESKSLEKEVLHRIRNIRIMCNDIQEIINQKTCERDVSRCANGQKMEYHKNLNGKNITELREIASKYKLKKRSGLNKELLIDLIIQCLSSDQLNELVNI